MLHTACAYHTEGSKQVHVPAARTAVSTG